MIEVLTKAMLVIILQNINVSNQPMYTLNLYNAICQLYLNKAEKIEIPYNLAIPLLGIYSKELKAGSQRNICTPMLTAALFTIAKIWKQPKYPSMDEWKNKMWNVHRVEYYSALKKKEIRIHGTTWMNPKDIMLSEISQHFYEKYCLILLIWGT